MIIRVYVIVIAYLSSVVRSEIEWRTVALGENSLFVLPGDTVLSVLLHLTLSDLLAKPKELLGDVDNLEVTQDVVTFSPQNYWYRVCESKY